MYHFASSYSPPSSSGHSSDKYMSLNATQQKSASNPFFLKIEEELHDARRVRSHGQEDDMRLALDMVINRVSELSALLSEVYKTQAELEVQLNVTRSNLQLVSSNNEMLEEALKRNNAAARDIGWRRGNSQTDPRNTLERSQSVDYEYPAEVQASPPVSAGTPTDNRFFKFRFAGATGAPPRPSRPGTPSNSATYLTSPSMPSLPSTHIKELEDMAAALEKERTEKKTIASEKKALEAELESLSQALFEEANNMVAQERMKRSETEDELKEIKLEKEALRSALRLMSTQNHPRKTSSEFSFVNAEASGSSLGPSAVSLSPTHSRSSSRIGMKSRPESLDLTNSLPPLPPSPSTGELYAASSALSSPTSPSPISGQPRLASSSLTRSSNLPRLKDPIDVVVSPSEEDSQPTPRSHQAHLHGANSAPITAGSFPPMEDSPWADISSSAGPLGSFGNKSSTGTVCGTTMY